MIPHNSTPFAIGIDLGTGSCKSILLSPEGEILGQGSAGYHAEDTTGQWKEQSPDALLQAAIQSVREAISASGVSPQACLGVGLGGAMHSLLALDAFDHPLTGVITWADNRALRQTQENREKYDLHRQYQNTGCPAHPLYPLEKICWLREERSDLFQKTAWLVSAKEYVTLKLTGQRAVDYSIASASGLLNLHNFSWDPAALEMAGIDATHLFELADPRTHLGPLLPAVADAMGLPSHIPVYLGSSDGVNSNLGAGALGPDQMTCMIGTSGALRVIQGRPQLDPQERTWCYAIDPSHWLVGGAISNGGLALEWLRDAFSSEPRPGSPALKIEDLICWAEKVPAGSDGVICLPFVTGERSLDWNPNARGVFYGLQLQHNQTHMTRALLEGITFRLRSVLDALSELVKFTEIRASGGFVHSPFWLQMTADILGHTLLVPSSNETSGIGSADWVFLGKGLVQSLEDLQNNPIAAVCPPRLEVQEMYQTQHARYRQLYAALKDIFDQNASEPI